MAHTPTLSQANGFAPRRDVSTSQTADVGMERDGVESDIEVLLWSADLANLRRFYHQPYWEDEGRRSDQAREIEGPVRLESVADHSWKVADAAILLADRFPALNRSRCVELAIIHDKLELLTGDFSPIDPEATGRTTHAFNQEVAREKTRREQCALDNYLSRLRPSQRASQRELYLDIINMISTEAHFVCALDKLAALTYIIQKKPGGLIKRHRDFTLAYSRKSVIYYPPLRPHYDALAQRLRCVEGED